MSERTIQDVMLDDPATCINMGIVGEVLGLLGLDPNTVLDKNCQTCTLDDGTRAAVPGDDCPDCDGTGRVEINRVVVVPAPYDLYDDLRALRIGRAVLASEAIPSMDGFAEGYRLGWNHCRETFLAAGDDPDE